MDSDDWWYKKKLELSVNAINKGFDIVCHAEDWIKDKKIVKSVTYGPAKYASYKKLLYKKKLFINFCCYCKKGLLNESRWILRRLQCSWGRRLSFMD